MGNFAPIGLPPGGAFFTPSEADYATSMITLPNGMRIPVGALSPAAQALIADSRMKNDLPPEKGDSKSISSRMPEPERDLTFRDTESIIDVIPDPRMVPPSQQVLPADMGDIRGTPRERYLESIDARGRRASGLLDRAGNAIADTIANPPAIPVPTPNPQGTQRVGDVGIGDVLKSVGVSVPDIGRPKIERPKLFQTGPVTPNVFTPGPAVTPEPRPMTQAEQMRAQIRAQGQPMNDVGVMSEDTVVVPTPSMVEQFQGQGGNLDFPVIETTATASTELPGMKTISEWAGPEETDFSTTRVALPSAAAPAAAGADPGVRFTTTPVALPGAGTAAPAAAPQVIPAGAARTNVSQQAPSVAQKAKQSSSAFLQPTERKVTQASPGKPAGQVDDSFSYTTGDRGADQPAQAAPAAPTGARGAPQLTADQQFEKIMKFANGTPEDKAKLEEQISQDRAMGLLMAGLGTMGAASKPGATAFGSLAEGTMGGVNYYRGERRDRTAKELAAQKNRMEVGKMYSDLLGKEAEYQARMEDRSLTREQKAEAARMHNETQLAIAKMGVDGRRENAQIMAQSRLDAAGANGEGKDPAELKVIDGYVKRGIAPDAATAAAMVHLAKSDPVAATNAMAKMAMEIDKAAVETGQKKAMRSVEEYRKEAQDQVKASREAFGLGMPGPKAAPAPVPGAATMRYNPATGKIEPVK